MEVDVKSNTLSFTCTKCGYNTELNAQDCTVCKSVHCLQCHTIHTNSVNYLGYSNIPKKFTTCKINCSGGCIDCDPASHYDCPECGTGGEKNIRYIGNDKLQCKKCGKVYTY